MAYLNPTRAKAAARGSDPIQSFLRTHTRSSVAPSDSEGRTKIGDAHFMLAEENPRYNHSPTSLAGTSVLLALYTEDVDAFVTRAVNAGATLIFPVNDQFYGDRSGRLQDPFGHLWIISTH